MITPPIEKLLTVMDQKGYRVYNTPTVDWNLNIVGIRNKSLVPDKFDDTLIIFHNFMDHWYITYYPITTDPSVFYLKKPLNSKGTAILLEGQYKGVYKIDKHNNRYYALCQRLGDVSVYRDNDKNGTLALQPETIQTGSFGINIHKGPKNGNWGTDNNPAYSAGCQVFADSRHFNEFMNTCKNGKKAFGNKFTYTLLNEKDLE
ncbi:hypothetical protein [Aquimarina sediminis]|uniref:hypothetical protein n=1 Tax=Aquimarina sediminis TaxID=2070536 RepID=UPI000CA0210D|nr:hypothetical protein [Aquimarina sediminis]